MKPVRKNLSHIQTHSASFTLAFGDSDTSSENANGSILSIDPREQKIHDLQKLDQSFYSLSQNQADPNQVAVGYCNGKFEIFDIRQTGKPGTILANV